MDIKTVLKKKKIAVICGGLSSEREVSLRSGENVYQALKKKGYKTVKIDLDTKIAEKLHKEKISFAYIILHGCPGEDGTIQGLLDLLNIPYTGSGVLGSALAMNKIVSKQLFMVNHIPTPPFSLIRDKIDFEEIRSLGEPLIFKPYAEGSSVGVVKFNTFQEFESQIQELVAEYKFGVVEKFLQGRNVTVGVIENRNNIEALPILELIPENEFYDYDAKYTKGKTKFIVPAEMPLELAKKVKDLAVQAHKTLWCYGVSRVDMILVDQDIYILEVNTLPGMTATSDLPAEAEADNISFEDLVEQIVLSGYEKYGK